VIRLDDVTKTYRRGLRAVVALDGISLEIARGEFVSIMGPSGSGKSTLLYLVGGLDAPTSGRVWVDGHALDAMDDDALTLFRRRHLGFVFQAFNLLPTLTAVENVALPLLLDGAPAREASARAVEALDGVGMGHRRDHRPDALSGGEMQRVALARAFVIAPLVLLADEPTGNLDSATGARILRDLRSEAWRRGQTVVMVTHDATAAAAGDRIVTIADGRLTNDESPEVVRRRATRA
jgi:putative ABC transport system ATP-binding protein